MQVVVFAVGMAFAFCVVVELVGLEPDAVFLIRLQFVQACKDLLGRDTVQKVVDADHPVLDKSISPVTGHHHKLQIQINHGR